ncbi:unnamed protein product [Caenorhabditis sp. 36 PRJEB53466]|nr:unnamed protein product [Caenorhabditis sp. 36 PRJEB53466]
MSCEQRMNRLSASFNFAMTRALAAETKDDWITHLKAMSNVFTQACTAMVTEEAAKTEALRERDDTLAAMTDLKAKADSHDDVIHQLHLLLAAQSRNSTDHTSVVIFDKMCDEVRQNMQDIQHYRYLEAQLSVEKRRNERMLLHINELSKKNVMHLMATRFYARELAAMRQLMDLVHNAATIDSAVKSKLWDEIEAENRLLRLNTLWLINRINSADQRDAAFASGDMWHEQPRLVILTREHINQGLGLEITGGCDEFRPVLVTGKLSKSMADDDQLMLDDRILAIDGTFVTNTTSHAEVMEMLENESSKDFLALIVSQFNTAKYQLAHEDHRLPANTRNESATLCSASTVWD